MKLRRLAVRHFRKLRGPVALDPIGDGLTIVSGDNEEGKSTLLAALKCALFEHHAVGGAVREGMTSRGAGLVPEVEVDFIVGGQSWQLRKAFRRGAAELVCGTQRLSGDAAEDRLAELLHFQRRQGRSETRPEHQGLAALFWVDQGTSFGGFGALAGGRERIAAAVASELGTLTGGAGTERLAATVRERCDRFWTATFKEKGPLREAGERHASLAAEAIALRARVADLAGKEERLARLRDAGLRAAENEALNQASNRRDEARRRLEGIAAVEQQAALATERLKAGRAGLAQVEAADEQRRRLRAVLAADAAAWRQAMLDLDDRRAVASLAVARRDAAELADTHARAAIAEGEHALDHMQRVLQAADQASELQRLEASLAKARDAAADTGRLVALVEADQASQPNLVAVREAQGAYDRAAAALAAAATTLELRPAAGRTAARQGVTLDPATALELTERTTLELPGWGEVVVIPGGADIASRRAMLATATDRLAKALRATGAATLTDAEQRAAARAMLEREADAARARGSAAIEATGYASVDDLAARVATLRNAAADIAVEPDPEIDQATVAAAAERLAARRREAAATLAALRDAEKLAVEARQRTALIEQEARRLESVVAGGQQQLRAAELEHTDEALAAEVAAARRACLALEGEAELRARELRLADGETVKAKLVMAEREIAQLEAERARRERTVIELESELRAVGEDGLGERRDEHEGLLALAAAELGRVRREALAWKMLHEALDQARLADRQALLAPVVARLNPWLTRLFADAVPALDPQSLAPAVLVRGGMEESLGSLSLGTREQIAILVRLGVASLLAEREGEAPCLILDDALVYADEARFEIMKTILQRAARDLQILVLTCRPREYFGLDACYLRLENCRQS